MTINEYVNECEHGYHLGYSIYWKGENMVNILLMEVARPFHHHNRKKHGGKPLCELLSHAISYIHF